MDHDNVRSRIASLISDDRTLHALRHVSRATLQAPPPNEYFVARLQKMLSAICRLGGIAVVWTADSVYAIDHEGSTEDSGFYIYNQARQRSQDGLTRDQLVRFFIPLSGHVRLAYLASRGNGHMEAYIEAVSPVTYGPPRFELMERGLIC